MKLSDIKKLKKGQCVVVDMGYKFQDSLVYAHFERTEVVQGPRQKDVELCVIKPFMISEDKCGYANLCINDNMLVEPRQILKLIK